MHGLIGGDSGSSTSYQSIHNTKPSTRWLSSVASLLLCGVANAQGAAVGLGHAPVSGARPVPMRDVVIKGHVNAELREANGVLIAAIGTPIGRVPIKGTIHLQFDCAGAFRGTISYHPVVRFLARLKGVDLVTETDGKFERDTHAECTPSVSDSVYGSAVVESTELRGTLYMFADTVRFRGPAWTVGDSTYHSTLQVKRTTSSVSMSVNLYERGSRRHPPAD